MRTRELTKLTLELAMQYPIIGITGPRQSGKTTLVKQTFPNKPYLNLAEASLRTLAQQDPTGFLSRYPQGAIIDEAQNAPELFHALQVRVDQNDIPGEFVLSGSQNFSLLENITQSLAGRIAIMELLPFSIAELQPNTTNPFELIVQGFYPRLHQRHMNPALFYDNYIRTYIERDVRQIKNIENLDLFQKFLKICAARVGQLFNITAVAAECGIAQNTVKTWLSVLKASYIAFTLPPYFNNFNKRLVQQPKLYFYDTGVACSLLGISHISLTNAFRGALFENMIIVEAMKSLYNKGIRAPLYFWRDHHGHEIDLLFSQNGHLYPIEIKSSQTIQPEHLKGLNFFEKLANSKRGTLIYGGMLNSSLYTYSWNSVHELFANIEKESKL